MDLGFGGLAVCILLTTHEGRGSNETLVVKKLPRSCLRYSFYLAAAVESQLVLVKKSNIEQTANTPVFDRIGVFLPSGDAAVVRRMDDQAGAGAAAVAATTIIAEEEDAALRKQLVGLEAQRKQLASLLGDDPQGPLSQLQVCVYACVLCAVFRARCSSWFLQLVSGFTSLLLLLYHGTRQL